MLKQKSKEMIEFLQEDRKLLDVLDNMVQCSKAQINLGNKVEKLRDLFTHYEADESQRLYLMDFMFE